MGKKKRSASKHHAHSHTHKDGQERDLQTIKDINECLQNKDLHQLRKLSCVRGLVNHSLRERCWGLLLGAETGSYTDEEYETWAAAQHRDRHVVRVDVARSLFNFLDGASEEELERKREQLERLLNAAVGRYCVFEDTQEATAAPTPPTDPAQEVSTSSREPSGTGPSTRNGASGSDGGAAGTRRRPRGRLSCLGGGKPATLSPQGSLDEPLDSVTPHTPSTTALPSRKGSWRSGFGCLGGTDAVSHPANSVPSPFQLSPHNSGSVAQQGLTPTSQTTESAAAQHAHTNGQRPAGADGCAASQPGTPAAQASVQQNGLAHTHSSAEGSGIDTDIGAFLQPGESATQQGLIIHGVSAGSTVQPSLPSPFADLHVASRADALPHTQPGDAHTALATGLLSVSATTTATTTGPLSAVTLSPPASQACNESAPQGGPTHTAHDSQHSQQGYPGTADVSGIQEAQQPSTDTQGHSQSQPQPQIQSEALPLQPVSPLGGGTDTDTTGPLPQLALPLPPAASAAEPSQLAASPAPATAATATPPARRVMSQDVYYYQGLHDIASVLLLVCGSERAAFPLLCRVVRCQLRDATRPALTPVMEVLDLLYPLVSHFDPSLAQHLRSNDLPPFFALSWLITWFAHDVTDVRVAARLFDVFLASHPLLPLYVGVTAMLGDRDRLMTCHEMPELHTALVNLQITRYTDPSLHSPTNKTRTTSTSLTPSPSSHSLDAPIRTSPNSATSTPRCNGSRIVGGHTMHWSMTAIDELVIAATHLYKECPPEKLVKASKVLLTSSVSPSARLDDTAHHWTVPDVPVHAGRVKGGKGGKRDAAGGGAAATVMRFLRQLGSRGRVSPNLNGVLDSLGGGGSGRNGKRDGGRGGGVGGGVGEDDGGGEDGGRSGGRGPSLLGALSVTSVLGVYLIASLMYRFNAQQQGTTM